MDANTMRDQLIARLRTTNYDVSNIDDREASDLLTRAELEFTVRRFIPDLNVKRKGFEMDSKRRLDLSGLITAHAAFKRVNTAGAGDFIIGTEDNGALRTPDKDYQLDESVTPSTAVTTDYGVFVRLPDECLFIISETCDTSKGDSTKVNVPVEVVDYEKYSSSIRDPYKSPYRNKVWRMDSGNFAPGTGLSNDISIKSISGTNADGVTGLDSIDTERALHLIPGKDWIIDKYNVRYVKRPRRILVDMISPTSQISSELPAAVHDEVVDIAVKLYTSARMPEQNKFQVADKEERENE